MSGPKLISQNRLILYLQTISRTMRLSITMAICVALVVAWYVFFDIPMQDNISKVSQEVQSLELQISLFSKKLTQKNRIQQEHDVSQNELTSLSFEDTKKMMAQEVFDIAKLSRVSCIHVKPNRQKQGKVYSKELFDIAVKGRYSRLLLFLSKLYTMPLAMKMVSCELKRSKGRSVEMNLMLDVVRKLNA